MTLRGQLKDARMMKSSSELMHAILDDGAGT
jgi:hypothetical protein